MTPEEVQRLQRDLTEARRSLADFEKAEKERWDGLLSDLLEVNDAFERVFDAIREKDDQVDGLMKIWVGNFRTVRRFLDSFLSVRGVRPMEGTPGEFDPRWHRVGETVRDPSKAEGTIVRQTRTGYLRDEEILRKAEVVVVRNAD